MTQQIKISRQCMCAHTLVFSPLLLEMWTRLLWCSVHPCKSRTKLLQKPGARPSKAFRVFHWITNVYLLLERGGGGVGERDRERGGRERGGGRGGERGGERNRQRRGRERQTERQRQRGGGGGGGEKQIEWGWGGGRRGRERLCSVV